MNQDYYDWVHHPMTEELHAVLKARRLEMADAVVTTDLNEKELFRIRGIVQCIDSILNGAIFDDDETTIEE